MTLLLAIFLAQVGLPFSMVAETGSAPTPTPTGTPTPTPGTVVATPVISPASGADQPVSVHITCATAGATIFYTVANTPGSNPIHSGTTPQGSTLVYGSTFNLTGNNSKTVKALGYKSGLADSAVATAIYNGQAGGGGQ
jgi:hypothetical protein